MPADRSNPQTTSASGQSDTTVTTTPSAGSMPGGYFTGAGARRCRPEGRAVLHEQRREGTALDKRLDLVCRRLVTVEPVGRREDVREQVQVAHGVEEGPRPREHPADGDLDVGWIG